MSFQTSFFGFHASQSRTCPIFHTIPGLDMERVCEDIHLFIGLLFGPSYQYPTWFFEDMKNESPEVI